MMTDRKPDIRRDTKHGAREFAAFVVGSLPLVLALFVTGVLMRSGFWTLISLLAGLPIVFLIMWIFARHPTYDSCGRAVRQKTLDTDLETGKLSYYCPGCNIRWITDLNAPGFGTDGGL